MNWHSRDLKYYETIISSTDETTLLTDISIFWLMYCRDVVPENDSLQWEHIAILMRGGDGRAGFYQKSIGDVSCKVAWACVFIRWWESIIHEVPLPDDPTNLSFEKASDEQDERFAKFIIEAAKRVDLACLAGRAESGIRLRFHRYDDQVPFMDVTLDSDNNEIHNELMGD